MKPKPFCLRHGLKFTENSPRYFPWLSISAGHKLGKKHAGHFAKAEKFVQALCSSRELQTTWAPFIMKDRWPSYSESGWDIFWVEKFKPGKPEIGLLFVCFVSFIFFFFFLVWQVSRGNKCLLNLQTLTLLILMMPTSTNKPGHRKFQKEISGGHGKVKNRRVVRGSGRSALTKKPNGY